MGARSKAKVPAENYKYYAKTIELLLHFALAVSFIILLHRIFGGTALALMHRLTEVVSRVTD